MTSFASSRRTFLKASAASLAIGGSGTKLARADEKPIIGIVYVGPRDDFGWNQAHAVAAKALKAIPGVTVVEDENIPETDACAKTMESMINLDGANIILGTSFGYFDPFMINLSKKYAKVEFRHAAPLWTPKIAKESRQLLRLPESGSLRGWRRRRAFDKVEQDRLCGRKADRIRAQQHKFVAAGGQVDKSEGDRPAHLHWRLVAAGARGGSHQRAGRCRLRRHHMSRRQSEGRHIDRREARRENLRPQCLAGAARAQGLHHRRRIQVDHHVQGLRRHIKAGKPLPNMWAGGYESDMVQNTPLAPVPTMRPARPRTRPSPTSRTRCRSTLGH